MPELEPEPEPEPEPHLQQPSADEILALAPGLLTQGRQGGHPAPLASRLHRVPTHFLSNLHGI